MISQLRANSVGVLWLAKENGSLSEYPPNILNCGVVCKMIYLDHRLFVVTLVKN
jgi:hypothetical protein